MRSAIVWASPSAVKRFWVVTSWFCITITAPKHAATTTDNSDVAIIISMSV